MGLTLSQNPEADALLDRDPLALLIAMVLDQQVPLERAFSAPLDLTRRLGHPFDAHEIADYDPDALAQLFATPPALHRYPKSMAARVQQVCRQIVERYDGDPTGLWSDAADGRELLARLKALPGFGEQKAKIFLALLGKQRGVRPAGWREAAGSFGQDGVYQSVADITDGQSLLKVREYKQQLKAAAKAAGPKAAGSNAAGSATRA